MTLRISVMACMAVLVTTITLPAQVFIPGNPYVGGFGVGYSRVTPHSAFHIGFGTRAYGFGPGYGFGPWGYNAINQTTVIVNPPVYYPRGILIDPLALQVMPPAFFGGAIGNTPLDREIDRMREALPRPLPDPNRGLFPPRDREEDRIEVRIDRQPRIPVRPAVPAVPAVPPPPVVEKPKPVIPKGQRFLADGKAAFARGEYGRAAERFGQAIRERPEDAPAWFLRSQARMALGKYLDAAEDLREGLRRSPDGLVAGFLPTDLYGEKAGDYAEHRKLLEQTRERLSGDPHLALLSAVQCWLAGDQVEAKARMEKFQGADRALVESFLQAAARVAAAPR